MWTVSESLQQGFPLSPFQPVLTAERNAQWPDFRTESSLTQESGEQGAAQPATAGKSLVTEWLFGP